MRELGMLTDAPDTCPARQLVYRSAVRVNPQFGGFLRSNFTGNDLAVPVDEGTLLGSMISPYTGETLEELRAPIDGILHHLVARDEPLDPGEWAFGLADSNPKTSQWVEK